MRVFDQICNIVFGLEGGALSTDPDDRGNWTGGAVGVGVLRGSRWGISAAAFPSVDIVRMSRADAAGLAYAHYWLPIRGDEMPPALALLVFDAAYNCGIGPATRMMQNALGLKADGVLGPVSRAALRDLHPDMLSAACSAMQSQRLLHMSSLSSWPLYGPGWSRRLCDLLVRAAEMIPVSAAGGDPAQSMETAS